MLFHHKAMWMV